MSRQEEVEYFLTSGHIWPPTVEANPKHPFIKALKAVLLRLPEEVFSDVEWSVQFIVESHKALAFNVPFEMSYPGEVMDPKFRLDTIVIYEECFNLSHEAFMALIAHEIAHTIVSKRNHSENEAAANEAIISWGFDKEYTKYQQEKKNL